MLSLALCVREFQNNSLLDTLFIKAAVEAESTYPCTVSISTSMNKLESVREDYSKALLTPFGGDL